jgi:FtsH-binding integral membrane protein
VSSKISVANLFNGIANFIGVIGVLGSLIFVGLELR